MKISTQQDGLERCTGSLGCPSKSYGGPPQKQITVFVSCSGAAHACPTSCWLAAVKFTWPIIAHCLAFLDILISQTKGLRHLNPQTLQMRD